MRTPAPPCLNYYPWQGAVERLHVGLLLSDADTDLRWELQGWPRAWTRETSSLVQCGERRRLACAALTIALSASDFQNTKRQLNRRRYAGKWRGDLAVECHMLFTKGHHWSRLTALCVRLMQSVQHQSPLVNHMQRISFSSSISGVLFSNASILSPSFSPGRAMCGTRSRRTHQ